jgi:hypothetical protein
MTEIPASTVRSYPAFRMSRLFRVYVDRDALYLIRMRGVIGHADAGDRFDVHLWRDLTSHLLHWWVRRSLAAATRELDDRGPRGMLDAHRQNLRVERCEVSESRLEPPRLLGHGEHFASWSLTLRDRKPMSYQIEDAESLQTALAHLPRFLGAALQVTVAWDNAGQRPIRVNQSLPAR